MGNSTQIVGVYRPDGEDNEDTLPETNIAPENRPSQKETIVFQPSIFRCELLVSGRVDLGRFVFLAPVGRNDARASVFRPL